MDNLICKYTRKDFNEMVSAFLTGNKVEDFTKDDLVGVFYTDGGSRVKGGTNYGGWGVHGYTYVDKQTNSNSGSTKATPTKRGYVTGKINSNDEKAFVVNYIDYYGCIPDNSTNNRAEAMAMLKCLYFIKQTGLKKALILADSKYVIGMVEHKETYKKNGFMSSSGKPLANQELCRCVIEMYDEVAEDTKITIDWVKGHSGDYGNDSADSNATKGCYIAANRLGNIITNNDSRVVDDYNVGDDYFNIGTPDNYFTVGGDDVTEDVEASKMLSENSLFFTTNGIDIRENTTYYQASFGKAATGKDKAERKMLRGKPFSDCCISVVKLFEPDPVINSIINLTADNFPNTGVIECNLSYQTRKSVYTDLMNGGLNSIRVDINKERVTLPNDEELAALSNPVRQTFKLINDFNAVKEFLDRFTKHDCFEIDTVTDITELLYDKKEGKKKVAYKVKPFDEGYITVTVNIGTSEDPVYTNVPVSIGVDTPSRVSLGRMKDILPKISLVTWQTDARSLRFATLIETTQGIGVWMGIYSNVHLH